MARPPIWASSSTPPPPNRPLSSPPPSSAPSGAASAWAAGRGSATATTGLVRPSSWRGLPSSVRSCRPSRSPCGTGRSRRPSLSSSASASASRSRCCGLSAGSGWHWPRRSGSCWPSSAWCSCLVSYSPEVQRDGMGRIGKVNDWTATRLGVVFGSVWVVWVFFTWPLVAQFMGPEIGTKTSYYAQSWVQLFALPLFVYIGNKLQRSSDAQSEVIHSALSHIATLSDQNKTLIEQNTELTTQ